MDGWWFKGGCTLCGDHREPDNLVVVELAEDRGGLARRMVAAWNAVEGIDTDALGLGVLDEILDAVYELVAYARDQGDREFYTFHENVIDPLVTAFAKLRGEADA